MKGQITLFKEIMAENFLKSIQRISSLPLVMRKTDSENRTTKRINKKKSPGHIIVKFLNTQSKETILGAPKEKDSVSIKELYLNWQVIFPQQQRKSEDKWNGTFNVLREDKCQTVLLYPAK